jgi:hypothetical protein
MLVIMTKQDYRFRQFGGSGRHPEWPLELTPSFVD